MIKKLKLIKFTGIPRFEKQYQERLLTMIRFKRSGLTWEPIFSRSVLPAWFLYTQGRVESNQQQGRVGSAIKWGTDWWEDDRSFSLFWLKEEGILEPDFSHHELRFLEQLDEDFSKTPVRGAAGKLMFDVDNKSVFIPRSFFESFYWRRIRPYSRWLHEVVYQGCTNYLFLYQQRLGASKTPVLVYRYAELVPISVFYDLVVAGGIVAFLFRPKKKARVSGGVPRGRPRINVRIQEDGTFKVFHSQAVQVYQLAIRAAEPEQLEILLRNRHKQSRFMVFVGFFTIRWRLRLWQLLEMSFINRQNVALTSFWIDLRYRGFSPRMVYDRLRNYYRRNRFGLFGTYETYLLAFVSWCWYWHKHAVLFFSFKAGWRFLFKSVVLFEFISAFGRLRGMGDIAVDGSATPARARPLAQEDWVADEFDEAVDLPHTFAADSEDMDWAGQEEMGEFSLEQAHPDVSDLLASDTLSSSLWPRASVDSDTQQLFEYAPPFLLNVWEYICNITVDDLLGLENPVLLFLATRLLEHYLRLWTGGRFFRVRVRQLADHWFFLSDSVLHGLFLGFWLVVVRAVLTVFRMFKAFGVLVVFSWAQFLEFARWTNRSISVRIRPYLVYVGFRYPRFVTALFNYLVIPWRIAVEFCLTQGALLVVWIGKKIVFWHSELSYWFEEFRFWFFLWFRYLVFQPGPRTVIVNSWARWRRAVLRVVGLFARLGHVFSRSLVAGNRLVGFYSRKWGRSLGISGYLGELAQYDPDISTVRSYFWVQARLYAWGFWGYPQRLVSRLRFAGWDWQCRLAALWYGRFCQVHALPPLSLREVEWQAFLEEEYEGHPDESTWLYYTLLTTRSNRRACLKGVFLFYLYYQDQVVAEMNDEVPSTGYVD